MTKNIKHTMTIDLALTTLDDDQLIDYILEMPTDDFLEGDIKVRITKKRMAQWKAIMGFITELKESKFLDTNEKNHLRAWLIKDEYQRAVEFLEQKEKLILDGDAKETIFSLKKSIKDLLD